VFTARKFSGRIDSGWRIASFTGLAARRDQRTGPAEPDYDAATAVEPSITEPRVVDPNSMFAFPKGAQAGIFLHELFETLDFPTASGVELDQAVTRLLRKHGYAAETWQAAVSSLVQQVLDTELDRDTGLRLRAVGSVRRLNELKFHFPLARLDAAPLNKIVTSFSPDPDDLPGLDFDQTRGMMLGFIDLVFEHGGRYYLLDYKSNHLGNRIEDYALEHLVPVMRSHRYNLQSLIYAVAVHRYLRHRIRGYRYAEHFGVVYYLFLRGMDAARGAEFGVHAAKPAQALIERLDALFGGDLQ
jgi:exodeoxyribonuclease V beta subunit